MILSKAVALKPFDLVADSDPSIQSLSVRYFGRLGVDPGWSH